MTESTAAVDWALTLRTLEEVERTLEEGLAWVRRLREVLEAEPMST